MNPSHQKKIFSFISSNLRDKKGQYYYVSRIAPFHLALFFVTASSGVTATAEGTLRPHHIIARSPHLSLRAKTPGPCDEVCAPEKISAAVSDLNPSLPRKKASSSLLTRNLGSRPVVCISRQVAGSINHAPVPPKLPCPCTTVSSVATRAKPTRRSRRDS